MNLENIKYFYFLGIGGVGMSALARYFKAQKKNVFGYDKTSTKLTEELMKEGIKIHFDENLKLVKSEFANKKSEVLVVYTPAVPKEHVEYNFFSENGFTIMKRSEVLGELTKKSFTIAVAGTHGKTTTSSLIAHILRTAKIDCSAFLGGITQNYNTNLLIGRNRTTVVEADEYDRSFLTLHPDIAVITSVDADHLDIYGDKKIMHESYDLFAGQVKENGKLILKKGVEQAVKCENKKSKIISYSLDSETDLFAKNISISKGEFHYEISNKGETIKNISLGIPGRHNIENSVAAIAAVKEVGVDDETIKKALASFKGVKRRFEYHIKRKDLIYIDDYAHHPEELKACITAIRDLYPDKKITGIFQPHLYTRTRDFANDFARSLDLLDELILLEIYPAREKPIEGITSTMLLKKMKLKEKKVCSKDDLLREIKQRKLEILLTAGAGDIDMFIEPITKLLSK